MKIEISIPTPSSRGLRHLGVAVLVILSVALLAGFGLAAWLLFLAFCLLLLGVGLAWASVTVVAERNAMTLEEALDLAAPDRDEERKIAVLRGIKDLEYERGLGKISEADYIELIRRYRTDAKRLLQKLDTSEASLRQQAIDSAEALLRSDTSPFDKPSVDKPSVDNLDETTPGSNASPEGTVPTESQSALNPKDPQR